MEDILWTIAATVFFGSWAAGVVLGFLIKRRIKSAHPKLHDQLYAPTIVEHNIKKSLSYQKFSMFSSNWKNIDDEELLSWLSLQRVVFFIMLGLLATFFAIVFIGLLLEAGGASK